MAWKEWVLGGPKRQGQVRWIAQLLILSGALNIALVTIFVYSHLKSKEERGSYAWRPVEQAREPILPSNSDCCRRYLKLSFQELAEKLSSTVLVEDGYAERDLALAVLVAVHDFDLERAMGGPPREVQPLLIGENAISLFPGIRKEEWSALLQFCRRERWPFTPKGLFSLAKRQSKALPASLVEALSLTPHFEMVALLLGRAHPPVEPLEAFTLILEGEWEPLEQYIEEQRVALDLSDSRRRQLLTDYLDQNSQMAARLLVRTDRAYAAHRLTDEQVVRLLQLTRDDEVVSEVAASPRPRAVLSRQEVVKVEEREVPVQVAQVHEVQPGESLWVVAKRYGTSVEALVQLNGLKGETIRVGQRLKVPDHTRPDAKGRT